MQSIIAMLREQYQEVEDRDGRYVMRDVLYALLVAANSNKVQAPRYGNIVRNMLFGGNTVDVVSYDYVLGLLNAATVQVNHESVCKTFLYQAIVCMDVCPP